MTTYPSSQAPFLKGQIVQGAAPLHGNPTSPQPGTFRFSKKLQDLLGFVLLLGMLTVTGCSLAGDVTPPPALATAQMGAAAPVASPTPEALAPQEQLLTLPPPVRPDLQAGESLYQERCAPCHGPTGLGDGEMAEQLEYPPTALGDPVLARQAVPAEWYAVVTNGRLERFMPPFLSLDDASRWDVVAYALTLHSTPEELERGEALYNESCLACHGENGIGGEGGPRLNQPDRFAVRSLFSDYAVITAGREPVMPAYGGQYPDEDRWALAEYIQSFAFQSERDLEIAGEPQSPTRGTITGSVVNASTGESTPAGLQITLLGYDGQEQVISQTTETDAAGDYRFTDIEVQPGRLFFTTLDYQGVGFRSEVFHYLPGQEGLNLPITIYETSQDTSGLQVDRLHLFFDPSTEGVLQVLELWIISNPTTRVIGPGETGLTLEVTLPPGAENLQFEGGEELGGRYVRTEQGFGLRAPVLPGTGVEELVFSFLLPYDQGLNFEQEVPNLVEALVILTPGAGPDIRGQGLEDLGVQAIGNLELRSYRGPSLSPGERLELRIAGPSIDFPLAELAFGLAALGGAILLVAAWWFRSGKSAGTRSAASAPERGAAPPAPPAEEPSGGGGMQRLASREELVRAIAALDADYEAARVGLDEYQARRELLKQQALKAAGGRDG